MLDMAKKTAKPPPAEEPEKRPKPISYRPHPALGVALRTYITRHRYPPSLSVVLDEALADFLRKEGFDIPDDVGRSNRDDD